MTDKQGVLINQSSYSVAQVGSGPSRILSNMVSDTLVLAQARTKALNLPRHRVGDYDLCDPDHRQILIWAKALEIAPEEVMLRLEESGTSDVNRQSLLFPEGPIVENGIIKSFVWDFDILPIQHFEWDAGLLVEKITFLGKHTAPLGLRLRNLKQLFCGRTELTALDLSNVPKLTELHCFGNQLRDIDLSYVPLLTSLGCRENQLTELDLSYVPLLTSLGCHFNPLIELDLSPVPLLTILNCSKNQLTRLDLSYVPQLTYLGCSSNQLTELNLSSVPLLTELNCFSNQLTELDLSSVPLLTELTCYSNQLTELNLSSVPLLTDLWCSNNQLTELDLSSVPLLTVPLCDDAVFIMGRAYKNNI